VTPVDHSSDVAATALEREYSEMLPSSAPNVRTALEPWNAELRQRLERMLTAGQGPPLGPIVAGVLANHRFEAMTTRGESGTLILVDLRLLNVSQGVAAVAAAVFPGTLGGERVPPDLPEADAPELIRGFVESAVTGESFQSVAFELSPRRRALYDIAFGTLVNFVIAHELAHITLGHLNAGEDRVISRSGKPIRISLPSWRMEFAADITGFRTANAAFPDVRPDSAYAGPVLFLEIVDLMASMITERNHELVLDVSTLVTHPLASARRSALITGTQPDAQLARLPAIEALVELMARVRGGTPMRLEPDALEQLRHFASECDVERYRQLLPLGEDVDGVVELDLGAVIEYVKGGHDRTRAAVAFAVFERLFSGPAVDAAPRNHLGLLYGLYSNTYVRQPNPHSEDAAAFDQLVRACVPDLDDLVIDIFRTALGQRPEL
jgi:hypothetical protein